MLTEEKYNEIVWEAIAISRHEYRSEAEKSEIVNYLEGYCDAVSTMLGDDEETYKRFLAELSEKGGALVEEVPQFRYF